MKYRPVALLAALCLTLHAAAVSVSAQPLAGHVPPDALVYVGWAGSSSEPDAYLQSTLKQVVDLMDTDRLAATWESGRAALLRAIDDPDQEDNLKLLAANAAMFRSPSAMVLLPPAPDNPRPDRPGLLLLCTPRDADQPALLDALRRLEFLGQQNGEPVRLETLPTHIALSFNLPVSDADMRPDGTLANALAGDEGYAAARTRLGILGSSPADPDGVEPMLNAYVNLPALIELGLQNMIERGATPERIAMFETMKLDGLGPLSLQSGFDGRVWTTRLFLAAPAPRTGLPGLLDAPTLTDDHLALVPRSATWATAVTFDHGKLMDLSRELANAAGPEAADQFEQSLAMLSGMLGTNVEENFIRGLGPAWLMYLDPLAVGQSTAGLTLVNPLADPEGVAQALRSIQTLANGLIAKQNDSPDTHIQFQTLRHGEATLHQFAFPFVNPTWAVHGGNLYVGLYPQTVLAAIDHLEANDSLANRDAFKQLRDRPEPGRITGVSFNDLPAAAPNTYPALLLLESMLTGSGAVATGQPMPMLLPPLNRLTPLLSPSGATSWVDDAGYHFSATSPFPGSSALALQASGSTPLMGSMAAATLLPALSAARQTAQEIQTRQATTQPATQPATQPVE